MLLLGLKLRDTVVASIVCVVASVVVGTYCFFRVVDGLVRPVC